MIKRFIVSLFLTGYGIPALATMGLGPYSQIRTVKICATGEGHEFKCGSGVYLRNNIVLTAFHVVSDVMMIEAGRPRTLTPSIVVLRENTEAYEPAVLISSYPAYDIALIRLPGVAPQAILEEEFDRGEKVWAVGNPSGRDFKIVETYVSSLDLIEHEGIGLVEMISVDSKNNQITHGFSGGGLFTSRGLIGIVQLCSEEANTCLAMPTREINKLIKGELK